MRLITHSTVFNASGPPTLIMPIGDIQWSGADGDTTDAMLKRHVEWGVENRAWFLGMGDYLDTWSPSNRDRLLKAGLYDSGRKALDRLNRDLVRELYETILKPSRGRWLGLLEGHHYHDYLDGTTTDHDLAHRLDTPFLGTSALVRLLFRHGAQANKWSPVVIWCHHGAGSSSRAGGPLNKLDQLIVHWDADIYLMGHQTKKVFAPIDRCEASWGRGANRNTLIHRTKIIACTGGFFKGYKEGCVRGNYVERAMMPPVALGGILIRIRGRHVGTSWVPDLSVEG